MNDSNIGIFFSIIIYAMIILAQKKKAKELVKQQVFNKDEKPLFKQSSIEKSNIAKKQVSNKKEAIAIKDLSPWDIFIETIFTRYATFNGRATRKEFWSVLIIGNIISLLLAKMMPQVAPFFALAMLIPAIAMYVRRIRDTGISGHWGWILIPLIFPIFIIGFLPTDSLGNMFKSMKKKTETLNHKQKFHTMNSQADTLLKYHEMLGKGIISQEEFDKIKQELIH